MKKIYNILLLLILSFNSISQNLPSVCVGTTERYWVNGFNGNSTFEWNIKDINNNILSTDYYNVIGRGDTIEVYWNDGLLGGIYTFNVIEYSDYGCIGEPYEQNIVLNSSSIFIPFEGVTESVAVCYGETAELYPGDFLSYLWQDGSTNNIYYTGESGTHKVKLIDNSYGCSYNEIESIINPLPVINLGNDTVLFGNQTIILDAYNTNIIDYNWSTGENSSYITINNYDDNINIWVQVMDFNGCQNSDTINIKYFNDYYNLRIPKAFTPNGDGINDTWIFPAPKDDISSYYFDNIDVNVYNRWGSKVWEYNGKYPEWDGRDLNGRKLPMDSYHYIIRFKLNEQIYLYKGSITIIL